MRVALVHDWLTGLRGGEKCLHELALLLPDADLYTLVHVRGSTSAAIDALTIHQSPLGRMPGAGRHYRKLLPLFPWAIRRFQLEGYDLVISSSHAVAKGVGIAPGTPHLCYCYTPMRYVWDQTEAYLGRGLRRRIASPLVRRLRRFDLETSGPEHVSRFVAISRNVADRIRRHYGREASVVHPPVDVDRFRPGVGPPQEDYLLVGAFVPYKREGLAIEAFRGTQRRLVVVGDGPGRAALQAGAPPNVVFRGRVSDEELAGLYASCRALIYPQDEDFGIVAVEAQAAGRPVIAFARGGALETVIDADRARSDPALPATGLFFHTQTPEALRGALDRFEQRLGEFDALRIRRHAEQFAPARFRAAILAEIERTLSEARQVPACDAD